MAVTIIEPYTTTFGKRNKLEHHRNPSGTINKAKWLLSKSERDIVKLYSLICSIEAGLPLSFERKSWQAAFYMANYCILNKIEKVEEHFTQKNYKNYQSRKSTSSKNIPWYDCLLETLYGNIKKTNREQLEKRICELSSDLSRAKSQIEKMRSCQNCVNKTVQPYKEPCYSCHNRSEWRLSE